MKSLDFKFFFDEVKDLIKAIGTSSSANEERDERSVENYVRGNSNTNTNSSIGGSIVSNTTEPDPQGDIAVTKSFPNATGGPLINQETRPIDEVSVAAAPNNDAVVPNQETLDSAADTAIAPSKTDEVNTPDNVNIEKAATCKECGQALPVAKADEITKAEACADCGKPMNLCNCMGKAVDEKETAAEAAKETEADEKAEMKKSLWGGAFAPRK
jgi:hypothetical protein